MKHQLIHAHGCRCNRCTVAHPRAGSADALCVAIGTGLGLLVVAFLALANNWSAIVAGLTF